MGFWKLLGLRNELVIRAWSSAWVCGLEDRKSVVVRTVSIDREKSVHIL